MYIPASIQKGIPRMKQPIQITAEIFILLILLPQGVSEMTVEQASMKEKELSIPKVNNVKKSNKFQKFPPFMRVAAVGYAMKANPKDETFSLTGFLMWSRYPMTVNTANPDTNDIKELVIAMIKLSMIMGLFTLL
jgi:hypothetical protein